jgi:hypothetical protein
MLFLTIENVIYNLLNTQNRSTPAPTITDGIVVDNPVAKNSYRGSFFTDEGSWSNRTAKILNKDHGSCTKHKSVKIFESHSGLEGLIDSFVKKMYQLIYDLFSEEELEKEFSNAISKFGHQEKARKFIEGLRREKNKFCATFMQYVFSWGRTTTSVGEGYNARFKSYGECKAMLSKANLIKVHLIADRVAAEQYVKAIDLLVELRRSSKRWSSYYQDHLNVFAQRCAIEVKDCIHVEGEIYYVTRRNGDVTTVNLATRIMHLGIVYTIPTCDKCGDWCSYFIMCPCIIKALAVAGRKIEDANNIHPLHLLQLHPLWKDALKKCSLPDYDDLPHLRVSAATVGKASTPI